MLNLTMVVHMSQAFKSIQILGMHSVQDTIPSVFNWSHVRRRVERGQNLLGGGSSLSTNTLVCKRRQKKQKHISFVLP